MRERLEMVPVADLGARVKRGRRKRAAGVGAGLTAGLAAVLVVATLTAGVGIHEPGATTPTGDVANGVRYELTPDSTYPESDSQLDLRQGGTVLCGTEIDLSEPVVIHARNILERGVAFEAQAQVLTDGYDVLPPEFVQAGRDWLTWDYEISNSAGDVIEWSVVPLVLDRGVVVGVGIHEGMSGDSGFRYAATSFAPLPGDCRGVRTPAVSDGGFQEVLLMQASLRDQPGPWVTFIMPGTGLDVWHQGLAEYWATVPPPFDLSVSADQPVSTMDELLETSGLPFGDISSGAGVRHATGFCERARDAYSPDDINLVPTDVPAQRPEWIFGPDWDGSRGVSILWRERYDGVDSPWFAYGANSTLLFFDASGQLVSIASAEGTSLGTSTGAYINLRMDFAGRPQCGITAGAPGPAGTYRVIMVMPDHLGVTATLGIVDSSAIELWVDLGDVVIAD
jgi:hypothetical protein